MIDETPAMKKRRQTLHQKISEMTPVVRLIVQDACQYSLFTNGFYRHAIDPFDVGLSFEDERDMLINMLDRTKGVLQDEIEEDVKKHQETKWPISVTNTNGNIVFGNNNQVNSNNRAPDAQLLEKLRQATQTLNGDEAIKANAIIEQIPQTTDPERLTALLANLCTIAPVLAQLLT